MTTDFLRNADLLIDKFLQLEKNEKEDLEENQQESDEHSEIDSNISVSELAFKYTPKSWEQVFLKSKDEIQEISDIIEKREQEGKITLPYRKDIFRVFHICPVDKVKVVIFGQDPYPDILSDGNPRAQGLSFSVSETANIPKSLTMIFKELTNSIEDFVKPKYGDLTPWVKQGVFLLNSSLTVELGAPASHGKIWFGFILKVITEILNNNKNVIFLLWGEHAKNFGNYINSKYTQLFCPHPATRNGKKPFVGNNHFVMVNEILKAKGMEEIDWKL